MKKSILGLDLGGSNLFVVAFEENNNHIILEEKLDTNAKKGMEYVIQLISNQIIKFTEKLQKEYEISAIGLAIPGIVDHTTGYVLQAPNLYWNHLSLLEKLAIPEEYKKKLVLINDVNAGLYGELSDFKKKPNIAVAYFCGTGIGGAIAFNGKIFSGNYGYAGEVGHMIIKINGRRCMCGRKGCLEAYIGKWTLNKKIQKAIKNSTKTILKKMIDYDLRKTPIKSTSLQKAYLKGDPFTRKLLEKYYSYYLAVGISQTVNLLDPELIILGGGIMESLGKYLIPYIHLYLKKETFRTPKLVLSKKGDYAGVLGAALYAKDILKNKKSRGKT
ncbi:MAG: ROK family protein [Leptonema sp. (in: bacteria)]